MPTHDIIVVGGSAGSVEAMRELMRGLPVRLGAAVFVVIHMPEGHPSVLAQVLRRAKTLPVSDAQDGATIEPGHVYIACPGKHLVLEPGRMRVVYGPRENNVRPAIDPLFRSAASAYGPRVVGVILSGTLDDGVAGLIAIKQRGGLAVVQDPKDALYSGMPENALRYIDADYVAPIAEIPGLVAKLAETPTTEAQYPVSPEIKIESEIPIRGEGTMEQMEQIGKLSVFTCPECHGTLYELHDGELIRFRCQTGHAYSMETLEDQQSEEVEAAVWAALRALEEKAELFRRIAERGEHNRRGTLQEKYEEKARAAEQQAEILHKLLHNGAGSDASDVKTRKTGKRGTSRGVRAAKGGG